VLRPAAWILLALLLGGATARGREIWPHYHLLLRDRTNDELWSAAAQARGTILPGPGLFLVQLRTRRPVLLDPMALDMLPYAIEGAPAAARILDRAYGVDFFDPPPATRHAGGIEPAVLHAAWQDRSPDAWTAIGREFGVTDVLTLPGWRLRLPVVARGVDATLYRIP
jgi:hypothetical protein